MDPREIALFSRVFHLPAEITIISVHPSPTELVIGVACQAPRMECPECHQPSARIHGRSRKGCHCRVILNDQSASLRDALV
jgi:hypothetical protein